MLEHANQKLFIAFLGFSALFIAGCAAFFSVRGISLLFAGSMIPVAIMATSLEIGKLMTASFLYRQWSRCKFLMKFYLSLATVLLIGITSLGVYGYLSDAFDKTMTQVSLYESNIAQLEKQNQTYEKEIAKIEGAANSIDNKANESIERYQKIYDDYVAGQRARQDSLRDRLKKLDDSVAAIEAEKGGFFSDKTTRLKKLKEFQVPERTSIDASLAEIDGNIDVEYKKFLTKVEKLRETTEQVPDNVEDVNSIYVKIREGEQEILTLRESIRDTDIGSFKFIARSFDVELEDVVKWFIMIICAVFDPLAVVLIVALNMMIAGNWEKVKKVDSEKKTIQVTTQITTTSQPPIETTYTTVTTTTPTTTTTRDPGKVHVQWHADTDMMNTVPIEDKNMAHVLAQSTEAKQQEKIVERIVEVEKIVEVPTEVEKIVEVEKVVYDQNPLTGLKEYWKKRKENN